MSFLFPFFLAAAGAALVPLLLHLRRRPPQQRMEFSSLMFLTASPEVTTQRRRLERWFLLLLRCLALLLLALMFARPFLQQQIGSAASSSSAWVVVVDASASMQREGLWPSAQQRLRHWLGQTQRADSVSVLLFDETVRTLLPSTALQDRTANERQTLAAAALAEAAPSHRATHLDTALIQAVAQLGQGSAQRRIILLSDMQAGARVQGLRGFAWPEEVALTVEALVPEQPGANLSLALLPPAQQATSSTAGHSSSEVRVRVTSQPDATGPQSYSLHWQAEQPFITGQLPPGGSRVHTLPPVPATARAVQLQGDAHPYDNTLHLAPAQPQRVTLALVDMKPPDQQPADSASYYLPRAVAATDRLLPHWQQLRSPDATLPADLRWLVVCGALPSGTLGAQIQAWLQAGGHALWVLTPDAQPQQAQTLGLALQWTEATVKDYALLAELSWQEPELSPLADPALRDFSKVHFWKHRLLTEPSLTAAQGKVLAKYDTGHIAWARVPVGKGQLLLMTSGWQPGDSQLAFSSRFVPLLYGLLAATGVQWEARPQLTVGATLPAQAGLLTPPQGTQVKLAGPTVAEQAGIYTLQPPAAGAESQSWAVNLPQAESRTEPISPTVLAALGVQLQDTASPALAAVEKVQLLQEEHEGRQQYWLIALAMLLWVLGVETWLAGRVSTTAG